MSNEKWNVIKFSLNCFFLKKTFEFYRNNQTEPILIKGYSIARYYPQIHQRDFLDIDLVFSELDYPKAKSLSKSDALDKALIDIHKELRHLDTVPFQTLLDNSQIIKIDETEVRVLSAEDHLRVICVHWLTDGGEYKNKLWDVYYLVKNRPADFDWNKCLNVVSQTRRRWIVCTIGLAHKYLNLDLSGTPIEEEAKDLPKWLIKKIEKEWKSDIRLIPLALSRNNLKIFLQQIWKRFPPNPITSTINCEGDFDAKTRIFYQLRDIFHRIKL